MKKTKIIFYLCLVFLIFNSLRSIMAEDSRDIIHLVLEDGIVVIETRPDLAPKHVAQIKQLINDKQYDGVVFHRVIEGFMAQTGDVEFGNKSKDSYNINRAGTGGSSLPNIEAEFSEANHGRGAVSMARAQNPNSANSQFFICFADSPHLDRNYTAFGKVIEGMKFVDMIKRGEGQSGSVSSNPDKIISLRSVQ